MMRLLQRRGLDRECGPLALAEAGECDSLNFCNSWQNRGANAASREAKAARQVD